MSILQQLRYIFELEARLFDARNVIAALAHEVGGDPARPETVIAAAQSLRVALNRLLGYPSIPLDPDGLSQPFEMVGR